MIDLRDRSQFILTHTRLSAPPHVPEVKLHLADEAFALWEKTEEELGQLGLPPPFWAFAWAGGQGVARYLLDHPEWVSGKKVLDLASGSGLVAVAAMKAGARSVLANDIDEFAMAAITLNAKANGCEVALRLGDVLSEDPKDFEVILAGDVFYQQQLAERVTHFMERAMGRGARVLVGDPGRAYLPKPRFVEVATYEVQVTRALEDAEVKKTTVWTPR